ncbi:MAG: energy-coupling factor transporter transmembrane component T family protein [Nitrososphaerales archaeon]
MSSSFDVYVRRNTWLYCLDPRVKLAFVFVASTIVFLWPSTVVALGVSAASLALLLLADVPRKLILSFLRGIAFLLLLVLVLTTLFTGGGATTWFAVGPLHVTAEGFLWAALLTSRLLALSLAFFFWLSTTDQGEMTRGFVALGLPYDWGLMIALALRYLPILAGLFEQVREAQEARGLDLAQRGLGARLQAYRPILIAVVIGALRHGERLGWALEARALGGGTQRTVFRPLRLRQNDVLALVFLGAILGGAVALRLM